jgi:hypothetical protein
MTLTELLRIGDRVMFYVPEDHRGYTHTYDSIPDGTEGTICGFFDAIDFRDRFRGKKNSGVYHTNGCPSVLLKDGRIVPGDHFVELIDKEEKSKRNKILRGEHGILKDQSIYLGELPETKFWEFDLVSTERGETTIVQVDYSRIHKTCQDGSPWPIYEIKLPTGGTCWVTEDSISLVKRGNLWNYYHNEPLVFTDLQEEGSFFIIIGEAPEIRNPANGLYKWTKDEVIAAIKSGLIHGFTISQFITPHICARRFNNEELGARVAKATMEGFTL